MVLTWTPWGPTATAMSCWSRGSWPEEDGKSRSVALEQRADRQRRRRPKRARAPTVAAQLRQAAPLEVSMTPHLSMAADVPRVVLCLCLVYGTHRLRLPGRRAARKRGGAAMGGSTAILARATRVDGHRRGDSAAAGTPRWPADFGKGLSH